MIWRWEHRHILAVLFCCPGCLNPLGVVVGDDGRRFSESIATPVMLFPAVALFTLDAEEGLAYLQVPSSQRHSSRTTSAAASAAYFCRVLTRYLSRSSGPSRGTMAALHMERTVKGERQTGGWKCGRRGTSSWPTLAAASFQWPSVALTRIYGRRSTTARGDGWGR